MSTTDDDGSGPLPVQVKQVTSMLHDRQQCATVMGLTLDLQISRTAASALLEAVAEQEQSTLHATVCQSNQTDEIVGEEALACTVFRLSTKTMDAQAPWKSDETCVLMGLSTGEETFGTAHERALAQLRDTKDSHPSHLACDVIAPAPEVQAFLKEQRETSRPKELPAPLPPQKATTAADYFGKKKQSVKTESSTTSSTKPASSQSKASAKSKASSASSMFQRASSTSNNKPKATVQQDEKENNKRSKTVGNADDFVGDVEESDDEEEVMQKPAAIVRQRAAAPEDDDQAMIVDDDEENEEKKAKPTIYGAMDDFAKPKESSSQEDDGTKRRRRRKRTVAKTFKDKDGYLRTEMQEVWEDVPSDEEMEEVKAKPVAPAPARMKKKVVKKSGMKQGTLGSFFSKKK